MAAVTLITPQRAGGAERDADTHGMVAAGAGQTGAGEKTIGSIVLPAGGPWTIFGLWGQAVQATEVAAEFTGGYIGINASAGDLDPNPAPTKFPIPAFGSSLGTALPVSTCPLKIWPIQYMAPGKAAIDLIFSNDIAMTVAPQVVMGIIFGKTIPEDRRMQYCDQVRGTVTATTSTSVGTITFSERASRITALGGILAQDGVHVTIQELLGYFTLTSDDVKLPPAEFPFSAAHSGGLGATIGSPVPNIPVMFPVNIPIPGGARFSAAVKLNTAVTNAANVAVYAIYE